MEKQLSQNLVFNWKRVNCTALPPSQPATPATRGKGATCPQWLNENRRTVNRQYVGEILPSSRVTHSLTKTCWSSNEDLIVHGSSLMDSPIGSGLHRGD